MAWNRVATRQGEGRRDRIPRFEARYRGRFEVREKSALRVTNTVKRGQRRKAK